MATPFEVLGVERNASEADIKAAFKAKAKEWHPDKHPNDKQFATSKFTEISTAYDELKDGKAATWGASQTPFGNQHGFRDPFAGMSGFGTQNGGFPGGFTVDIGDIMRNYDEQMRKARGRNRDIGIPHLITLEEAQSGTSFNVSLNLRSGHKVISITVPPGVDTGTRLHVPGKGEDSDPKLPPGDLFVNIQVVPHNDFLRNGLNLIIPMAIDIFAAILGGKLSVRTLNGKTVEVTVPKGSASGSQLRVTGYGMPDRAIPGRVGDLIVALEVKMPSKLNPDQIDFIAAARDAASPSAKELAALKVLRA